MDTTKYPKVLLCAPQHESKMYCWDAWHERITSLTYPNYDILICDNSDTFDNINLMSEYDRVKVLYTPDKKKGLLSRINDSHKQCADYAIKKGYDYIFHLETDVFPPLDVIERLMARKRVACAGVYDIFFGKRRKAMVQMKEGIDRTNHAYNVVEFLEHDEPRFFDGTVKEVYHAGLGCILIHRDVFNVIKFRVVKGIDFHTDTWFANDCFIYDKDIYVDTTVMCDHYNQTWLSKKDELV